MKCLGCLLGVVLVFGSSAAAKASLLYPDTVMNELGLEEQPECILCHQGQSGQLGREGTATKPFAETLKRFGAQGDDSDSLARALGRIGSTDSDGDQVSDIEELVGGSDPNVRDVEPPPPGPADGAGGEAGSGALETSTGEPPPPPSPRPLPHPLSTGCTLGPRHDPGSRWLEWLAALTLVVALRRWVRD